MRREQSNTVNATPISNVRQLLDSPEGQKALMQAIETGIQISQELNEKRRVSLKSLREPFTI